MIITTIPFDFSTNIEVSDEWAFSIKEINSLSDQVNKGGSLLVFSEHAPFGQAINPLLKQFRISSSIGTTIDALNHNKKLGNKGWIEFTQENGGLNKEQPIINENNKKKSVNFTSIRRKCINR